MVEIMLAADTLSRMNESLNMPKSVKAILDEDDCGMLKPG